MKSTNSSVIHSFIQHLLSAYCQALVKQRGQTQSLLLVTPKVLVGKHDCLWLFQSAQEQSGGCAWLILGHEQRKMSMLGNQVERDHSRQKESHAKSVKQERMHMR